MQCRAYLRIRYPIDTRNSPIRSRLATHHDALQSIEERVDHISANLRSIAGNCIAGNELDSAIYPDFGMKRRNNPHRTPPLARRGRTPPSSPQAHSRCRSAANCTAHGALRARAGFGSGGFRFEKHSFRVGLRDARRSPNHCWAENNRRRIKMAGQVGGLEVPTVELCSARIGSRRRFAN